MNKQRKVVITTTYNEMGIIIDTKAEEVAQPEITEEERRQIKKLRSFHNGTYAKALDKLMAFASVQPESKWIPCSERLPDKNGRYLCTNSRWGAYEVDWNAWINGEWLYPNEKPVAWMPLPEPYKGGGKNE